MQLHLYTVLSESARSGLKVIIASKMRSLLTMLGIVIGFGFTRAVSWFMNNIAKPPVPWVPALSLFSILFAIFACTCVGVFFGLYPAYKASLLAPVDALRRR